MIYLDENCNKIILALIKRIKGYFIKIAKNKELKSQEWIKIKWPNKTLKLRNVNIKIKNGLIRIIIIKILKSHKEYIILGQK